MTITRAAITAGMVLACASVSARQTAPAAQRPALPPAEQQVIDAQLSERRLDPAAAVTKFDKQGTPRELLGAIGAASGVKITYDTDLPPLATSSKLSLVQATAADAIRVVTDSNGLAFKVLGAKSVFVYANTPANRAKYAESIRAFDLVKADPIKLQQLLSQKLGSGSDVLKPVFVSVRSARAIWVRATASKMAEIAKFIAENDK